MPASSRGWPSRLGAIVVLALVALTVVGTPASAAPAGTGTQSLQQLGACLTSTHHLDVLLLIDQSKSLGSSDPGGARVTAAQLLLARLADTAGKTGSSVALAVDGFDTAAQTTTPWMSLDDSTVPAAEQQVAAFANRHDGIDTDYWTALTSARQQLLDRRNSTTAEPCQALVLFTDGQFDLTPRTTAQQQAGATVPIPGVADVPVTSQRAVDQVVAAGKADLCRDGGVADALRSDGILLIALGLNADGRQDLTFLHGIAENPQHDCGAQPAYGFFSEAADVSDLVLAFDAVGDPGNPPLPPTKSGPCERAVCPQAGHTFTLDSSIHGIHLVGTSNAPGIDVYLQPPGARPAKLSYDAASPAGSVSAGAVALRYRWYADGAFAVDAEAPTGGKNWSGTWRVVFVDPTGKHPGAVTKVQLTIQADLEAAVHDTGSVQWRAGETAGPVRFDLVRADGTAASVGTPAPSLALDVLLHPTTGADVPLLGGITLQQMQAGVPLRVPATFPAGQAQLVTRLHVTTVSGMSLQPQTRNQPITVAAAFGFPSLAGPVHFGKVQGTHPTNGGLQVTGPGCVWVSPRDEVALQAQPAGLSAHDISVNGPTQASPNCGQDGPRSVDITVTSSRSTGGDLRGAFVVHLAPQGHPERALTAQVPFTALLERTANGSVLWVAFALALLIGIGLPVIVFLLGRRLAARLPASALQSALLDVTVGPAGLRAVGGGPVSPPEHWDLVPPPTSGRRRTRLSTVPVRARAGLRLTDAGFAEVEEERRVGVSGAPGSRSARSLRARLPLALQGSWTLLLDRSRAESDEAEVPAQLLVVTDSAATAQQREALIARARDEAPATAESLREAARARRAAGTTDEPAGLVVGSRAVGTDPFGAAPFAPPGGANAPTLTVDPFGQGAPRAADPFAAGGSVDRGALPIPHPRPGAHDERGVTPVDDPFSR